MSKIFVADKLKIQGNKTLSTVALILILTVSGIMASLPPAKAALQGGLGSLAVQGPDTPTFAFLNVAPNPVGVNQQALVVMWLDNIPLFYNSSIGVRGGNSPVILFLNYTVTVTKPDGTSETLGPFKSDPVASAYLPYTPTAVGNYIFQFHFGGQLETGYTTGNVLLDTYFKPSDSPKFTLVVQQQPITPVLEGQPLPGPNQYWTRPIYGENTNWWSISGNWLGFPEGSGYGYNFTGPFNPYTTAPNTAHIVWKTPISMGGLVGGQYGDLTYYQGLSYEQRCTPPVICNGMVYYDLPLSNARWSGGTVCQDLRTGTVVWEQNVSINLGQLYDYESPNQHGPEPLYLWNVTGPIWEMIDGVSGTPLIYFNNVYGGAKIGTTDDLGELLYYMLDPAHNWLAMWNSSLAIPTLGTNGTNAWQWRPDFFFGTTLNWMAGLQWNVSIPPTPIGTFGNAAIVKIGDGVVLAGVNVQTATPPIVEFIGYSDTTGQQLWAKNITSYDPYVLTTNVGPIEDGIFTWFEEESMQTYGFNVYTGQQIWGPTAPKTNAWGMYSQSYAGCGTPSPTVAYGKVYQSAYDGVTCYDEHTGALLWTFSVPAGFNTPYGDYPFYGGVTVADGKVFAATNEHSPNSPPWKGGALYALDANTGKELWNVSGWYTGDVAIADGYIVALNNYDEQLYCYGKGLTATTVSAPTVAVPKGTPLLIQGTVTDQSPAQKGTPAISDAYMTAWMEYLNMQYPVPGNAAGVPVTLTAIDPNGNTENIGTVTSDIAGLYSIMWTPPVPGKYTIIANFAGSNSYWPSYAETAVGVGPAPAAQVPIATPATTPPPTAMPTSTPATSPQVTATPIPPPSSPGIPTTYLVIAAVAIIIVVAAAALALRRRK